jgi:hypothetical protein
MKLLLTLVAITAFGGGTIAFADAAQPADAPVTWNQTLLSIVRTPGAQPATIHPTRSFAMLHLAILDAVQDAPPSASRHAAATVAAHDVLAALYPSQRPALDAQEQDELAQIHSPVRRARGEQTGAAAAARVIGDRSGDGSAATPPAYVTTGLPGDYRPTPPAFAAPVFTHWAAVRPFVLRSADQFRPPAPPALDSPSYTAAIAEVRSIGQDSSATRTADQTQIARFWAAPIQNYWNEIADAAAVAHHDGLVADSRLFAALDVTIADSTIAFYDAKYAYRFWRPITAIRDGGLDPAWTPLATTPADPSYPGAHSVVSAAASDVLIAAFGDHYAFTASSDALPGVTRSFPSFSSALDEAGRSRIYAGVHTSLDDVAGRTLGHDVARYALEHGPTGATPTR